MARADPADVLKLLPDRQDVQPDQFLEIASLLVDDVVAAAGSGVIDDDRARLVEMYLAAHFATVSYDNGPLAASTIGQATERYHDIYKSGLRATRFGQQALLLDPSGELAKMAAKAEKPDRKDAEFEVI